MENNICERVVAFWEKNEKILPEVLELNGDRPDLIEEVIDGISDTYQELLKRLRELCYG